MGKMEDIKKIRSTIVRYGMIVPGDRVIVAVSGGQDSVCLLDVLNRLSQELDISLVAAHYDHGLRQDEDEFETQLVRDIAASMGIPFETEKAPARLKASPSLEERARDARYTFLEKVRNKHGAQKIAMGHNLNDQAETVIMRLLRGSGPSGLAGIPPVRDNIIIRPLIEITRDEITEYLKDRGLPFATDSSNSNKKYLRNRIRLELMPALLEFQPGLVEHLGTLSNIIRDEDAFMESMASEWIEKELMKSEGIPSSQLRGIRYHTESSVEHGTDSSEASETASWIPASAGMTTNRKARAGKCHAGLRVKHGEDSTSRSDFSSRFPTFAGMTPRGEPQRTKPKKIGESISVHVPSIQNLPSPIKKRVIRNLLKQVDGNIYPMEYGHIVSVLNLLDNEQPQCSVDLPNGITVKKTYQTLHFKLMEKKRLHRRGQALNEGVEGNSITPHPHPLPQGERENLSTISQGERERMAAISQGDRERMAAISQGDRERMAAISQGEREIRVFSLSIEGSGLYHLEPLKKTLLIEETDIIPDMLKTEDPSTAYLDADKVRFPLVVRNFMPGDRFVPLGMKGNKKVKNFFIDLKAPSEIRALTPILTSGDKIVWVCGYRIDDRFKITAETKRVLKITLQPLD